MASSSQSSPRKERLDNGDERGEEGGSEDE